MPRDDGAALSHGPRNSGYPRRSGYAPDPYGFYVEPRWVVHLLLDAESFVGEVLDPCCGIGTIPAVCLERGIPARGSDLIERGFGEVRDMWSITEKVDNIISNPPYGSKHDGRLIHERVEHCLTLVRRKLALILPLTFWKSRRRHRFFQQYPPSGSHLVLTARRCRLAGRSVRGIATARSFSRSIPAAPRRTADFFGSPAIEGFHTFDCWG